ncbi:MAG TPA: hypothetical protein VIX83_04140 [Candidatus Cybelea sp.]
MAVTPSTGYQSASRVAADAAAAGPIKVKPLGENGWSQCTNPVWGTYWIQTTPTQQDEFTGLFQIIGGYVRVCGPATLDAVVSSIVVNQNNWANTSLQATAFWNGKCSACALHVNEGSSTVEVSHISPKNEKLLASFDTCSACLITGLAMAKDQTLYAAVESQSGSSNSSIYVWNYGSPSPTILPGQSGMTGVGVAVDAAKNVYWTANAATASGTTGEVWEYPYEPSGTYGSPTLLQSTSEVAGILLSPSAGGPMAYSLPSAGEVAVTTDGKPSYIKTGGHPEALSLDSTGTVLMVTDPVNNRISTYAFPEGKPIGSWSLRIKKHRKVFPTSMMSYLAPK